MEKIRQWLNTEKEGMLALLGRLVSFDSGSYCKEGIDLCAEILAGELRALGFQTETIGEKERGNHLRAERPGKGGKRLFLSAHLDSVWPAGTAAGFPFRVEEGLAYGPGVGDMKGGIVQMLYALKALKSLGREVPPISVFLTGDEELGSIRGRPHIEEIARRSAWVLVMESAPAPDVIVTRRWGVGAFYLTIFGRGAHVMDPEGSGVNACRELALKVLALEGLSDPLRGIKVSVNLMRGGSSRQMTAPEARADVDVRAREAARMALVEEQVRQVALQPIVPGARMELQGGFTRPPMESNPKTEELFRLAGEVGREMGIELRPGTKGGGSDGSFTAALGVATLDGLGPRCFDLYTREERIPVAELILRTVLTAGIVNRLAREG